MIATKVLLLVGMAFSATIVAANPVTKTCANVKCPVRCEMIKGNPTCVGGRPHRPETAEAVSESPCDSVRCNYRCEVINNQAVCVGPPSEDLAADNTSVKGEKCGVATCGLGESCCNESCGVCVPLGGSCAQVICEPAGKQCGPSVCSGDTPHCCNESCGICTAPDGFCTQQLCNRGFTPSESKRNAEADKIKLETQKCGKAICPEGMSCCNSSCGICVKPGGACTQQFCQSADVVGVEVA
ncbi:hypothetical protein SMACR_01548 [Sordaria macrospora]|uniref:WGS project CABT00000000 data, contig 2.4 n=2 Tax=Sordaria macrospora TaxID=5147 RepID=F7VR50_SORMK|nr:uncharacterized protein SMAC_01548 [Sordaria macrospora k-hell]KAA8635346.1 hypothetical protein SMACR_01548 [Sordaria macrospora]KAH7634657.1 hypothetical protein B0T09DRAFT_326910 [Sordaria sp. MPI-SDFR-AT-0083]WPJ58564.1 hypothetical protein SMAC4_01548 [Sordaria macrospora]CCC07983.1 unnamed protein product [Sordaria macrospora k-hell]